jgi:hypothetical protein
MREHNALLRRDAHCRHIFTNVFLGNELPVVGLCQPGTYTTRLLSWDTILDLFYQQ